MASGVIKNIANKSYSQSFTNQGTKKTITITVSNLDQTFFLFGGGGNNNLLATVISINGIDSAFILNLGQIHISKVSGSGTTLVLETSDNYFRGVITSNCPFNATVSD